jgi:hypothetical protein
MGSVKCKTLARNNGTWQGHLRRPHPHPNNCAAIRTRTFRRYWLRMDMPVVPSSQGWTLVLVLSMMKPSVLGTMVSLDILSAVMFPGRMQDT